MSMVLMIACEASTSEPLRSVDSALLTGIAAQSIDSHGQFVLPNGGGASAGEISREVATALGVAVWHSAQASLNLYESDRGAPIHVDALVACQRAFYVESAYANVPADAPTVLRKALGPEWLVGLCYGGVEEVVVSVSAYATDAGLTPDGANLSAAGQANFLIMGVPVGAEIPMSPEAIANVTARSAGRRIAVVPRLIMRPRPAAAQIAIWQIGLESAATVVGSDSHIPRARQFIFAGPLNGWLAPAFADQRPDVEESSTAEPFQYKDPSTGTVLTYTATRKVEVRPQLELVTFTTP